MLEAIGSINFQKSVQVLKPFGTIVTLPSGHTKADELQAQKKTNRNRPYRRKDSGYLIKRSAMQKNVARSPYTMIPAGL